MHTLRDWSIISVVLFYHWKILKWDLLLKLRFVYKHRNTPKRCPHIFIICSRVPYNLHVVTAYSPIWYTFKCVFNNSFERENLIVFPEGKMASSFSSNWNSIPRYIDQPGRGSAVTEAVIKWSERKKTYFFS